MVKRTEQSCKKRCRGTLRVVTRKFITIFKLYKFQAFLEGKRYIKEKKGFFLLTLPANWFLISTIRKVALLRGIFFLSLHRFYSMFKTIENFMISKIS
jgi:hypothetical protein